MFNAFFVENFILSRKNISSGDALELIQCKKIEVFNRGMQMIELAGLCYLLNILKRSLQNQPILVFRVFFK